MKLNDPAAKDRQHVIRFPDNPCSRYGGGVPAAELEISLFVAGEDGYQLLSTATTNADGRTDSPILPAGAFRPEVTGWCFTPGRIWKHIFRICQNRNSCQTSRLILPSLMPPRIIMCRYCCRPLAIRPIAAASRKKAGHGCGIDLSCWS